MIRFPTPRSAWNVVLLRVPSLVPSVYDPAHDLGRLVASGEIGSMTKLGDRRYGVTLADAGVEELRLLLPRTAEFDRETETYDVIVGGAAPLDEGA